LTGRTTAGADVTISGTLTGVGTAGTIQGTWIEADRYCLLLGDGTINAAPTSTTQKVSAPTFSPAAGSFSVSVTVTVSTATSGATIRYTTDNSDPTSSSAQFATPLVFSATTPLRARGFASGMTDSDVSAATYTKTTSGGTGGSSSSTIP
jgi:hypothetical protein